MPLLSIIPFRRFLSASLRISAFTGAMAVASAMPACAKTQADPAQKFAQGAFLPAELLWYDGTEVGEPLNTGVPKKIVKTHASSTLASSGAAASGRYAVANAFDGQAATAWCEGAANAGIGESISIRFEGEPTPAAMAIVPGYAKNEKVWRNNPRVLRFRIEFLRSAESLAELKATGEESYVREIFGELRRESDRIPFGREQYFDFRPEFTQDMSSLDFDGVRLEILAVEAAGAKFEDTCISKLRFFEWN